MKYNFDEVVDRKGTYSCKLDQMPEGAPSDALSVWVADMDFACAEPIIRALHERIDRKIFGYTIYDNEDLKHAVTGWFRRRYGWEVAKEDVFFSPGVVPALAFLLQALTSEGDGIIIQRPVYYPFTNKINGNNRKIFNSSLIYENGDYRMDYEDLEKKFADEAVKGMILCSPHNPVGRVFTAEELRRLGEICLENDVFVIADEIHSDLVYSGHKHIPFASISKEFEQNTISFMNPSKTFNLAGLQSSTIVFNDEAKKDAYVAELKRMDIARNNCFSLVATMEAYAHGEQWLDELLVYLGDNMRFIRSFCAERLPELKPNTPEATYLNWVDARALGMDDAALKKFCVEKAGVAFGEGTVFGIGGSGFLRLNAACPRSVIEKALTQMEQAVRSR